MTPTQKQFLDNLTRDQAAHVIAKFRNDPAIAAETSPAAYAAFCQSWELLNPGEYWQHLNRARADGGPDYRLISM